MGRRGMKVRVALTDWRRVLEPFYVSSAAQEDITRTEARRVFWGCVLRCMPRDPGRVDHAQLLPIFELDGDFLGVGRSRRRVRGGGRQTVCLQRGLAQYELTNEVFPT